MNKMRIIKYKDFCENEKIVKKEYKKVKIDPSKIVGNLDLTKNLKDELFIRWIY